METVTDRPPEGEPENITPGWCGGTAWHGPHRWAIGDGLGTRQCPGAPEGIPPTVEPENITPEVPVCLAASRHGGICGLPMPCDGSRHRVEPTPGPERRTVSLEVLTPALVTEEDGRRRVNAAEEGVSPELLPADARVGIALRIDGLLVAVVETDRDWGNRDRSPADMLATLIRSARSYTDDGPGELLMPTPDVLAALAGTPVTQALTAPVHVLAMDVKPGMLLHSTDDDGDGAETLELVSAADDCTDRDCVNGAVCAVLTVPGGGFEDPTVHFNAYARLAVRIPADRAVTE